MDHLDDLPEQLDAHHAMDEAGRWVRRTFGCRLAQDERGYQQTCPVALGHQRWGASIGARHSIVTCMVCGEDVRTCRKHVAGRKYKVAAMRTHGYCNVCGTTGQCDHAQGDAHEVTCWRLVTNARLQEISIVSRPAYPDARMTSVDVSIEDLERAHGPAGWTRGMALNCDLCLEPCGGFLELSSKLGGADTTVEGAAPG